MARSEARIKTAIWNDQDFTAHTIEQQWAYFVILSQSTVNLCGVTGYTPGRWSNLAADATPARLRRAINILAKEQMVVLDETAEELWIRTLTKHDGTLTKPNVVIGMTRDFGAIQSGTIRERFLEQLGERFPKLLAERFPDRFREGLWEQFGKPFREQFAQRFAYTHTSTHAEPFHHINRSANGSRCGACGNRGWVAKPGGGRERCPATCPASKAICPTCDGRRIVLLDGATEAIPCPDCAQEATA